MLDVLTSKRTVHASSTSGDFAESNHDKKWMFFTRFLLCFFLFFLPYAIVDRFYRLSLIVDVLSTLLAFAISSIMVFWLNRKGKELEAETADEIETFLVRTNKVIHLPAKKDGLDSFFIEVQCNGQPAYFYLSNLYVTEKFLEDTFPTTEFKLVRLKESQEIIDFVVKGIYLKPLEGVQSDRLHEDIFRVEYEDCSVIYLPSTN